MPFFGRAESSSSQCNILGSLAPSASGVNAGHRSIAAIALLGARDTVAGMYVAIARRDAEAAFPTTEIERDVELIKWVLAATLGINLVRLVRLFLLP